MRLQGVQRSAYIGFSCDTDDCFPTGLCAVNSKPTGPPVEPSTRAEFLQCEFIFGAQKIKVSQSVLFWLLYSQSSHLHSSG